MNSTPPSAPPSVPPWAPLGQPVFRMLWAVWMTANICMWMNDVAAAWLMTSLTTSPVMVALVSPLGSTLVETKRAGSGLGPKKSGSAPS